MVDVLKPKQKQKSKQNTYTDKTLNLQNFTTKPFPESAQNLSADQMFSQSEKPSHQIILISNLKKNVNKKREPNDLFINSLVEKKETALSVSEKRLTLELRLKQKSELRTLPPVQLLRFDENPLHRPEFIENFYNCIHKNICFNICSRMGQLNIVLEE